MPRRKTTVQGGHLALLVLLAGAGLTAAVNLPQPVARSAHPTSSTLYRAQPAALPPWARTGRVRFLRLDGGRIESLKAERTWWGADFSPREKAVLAGVYRQHLPRLLSLLEQARFNWVWVTWSNGWSVATEAENRADLRRVIPQLQRRGIRVTAYLSASNLFWRDTFVREPRSMAWLLYWQGLVPIPYGASRHRLLADVAHPEWRTYLLAKAAAAMDAGVDAIFYDNIFGDVRANQLLLSQTQRLAAARARQSGRPKVLVYANVHPPPRRFEMNAQCDLVWDEGGKDTPGLWATGWQVANVRRIKFLRGEKLPWQPLKFEHDLYHCGPRERCIPPPAQQRLSMAEASAFGAALSRNIEGRFLERLVSGDVAALRAWDAIAGYNRFHEQHPELYLEVAPAARVALLASDPDDLFAEHLIRRNLMFETKVLEHLDRGAPLRRFRVLLVPFALPRLRPSQRRQLRDFLHGGGTVVTTAPRALRRALGERLPSVVALPPRLARASQAEQLPPALARELDRTVQLARRLAGGAVIRLARAPHVLAQVTRAAGGATLIHLLSYDYGARLRRIGVTLGPGAALPPGPLRIHLLSPDGTGESVLPARRRGGELSFELPRLQRYAVAVVQPR